VGYKYELLKTHVYYRVLEVNYENNKGKENETANIFKFFANHLYPIYGDDLSGQHGF
jgi:hypothetical protein